MARRAGSSRGSSSGSGEESTVDDDDETSVAGTETTETTLIDRNEHDFLVSIVQVKSMPCEFDLPETALFCCRRKCKC